jgi:hypothetical protein
MKWSRQNFVREEKMKTSRILWLVLGCLLFSHCVVTEAGSAAGDSEAAVARAARQYVEAWYDGDEARLADVLHARFVRRIITRNRLGEEFFREDSRERMLEIVRKWGGDRPTPIDERRIQLTVLSVAGTTASARIDSAYYREHVHLVEDDGRWQVAGVLWENVPNPRPVVVLDASLLAQYAGEYLAENGVRLVVTVGDNCLLVKGPTEPASMVFPESATVFSPPGFKARFEFVQDERGEVRQLILRQRHREFLLEKFQ